MKYRVSHPTKVLKGEIHLTASKSESNRALIIQALCEDAFEIKNLAKAEDTRVLNEILQAHKSNLSREERTYDVGAAGTTMRFLTAYLSTQAGTHILTGTERMKNRPIGILVDALRSIGADIEYKEKEGYPPLQIKGKELTGSKVLIDGNVSSQYITALLLIAPTLKNGLTIEFKGEVTSLPYITMTLLMIKEFGVEWDHIAKDKLIVKPGTYRTFQNDYMVEGDWSSASYWYAFAALSSSVELTIKGLKQKSLQGDSKAERIFNFLGVNTEFGDGEIYLTKGTLKSSEEFKYDFLNCPDLAQTAATVSSALQVNAIYTGLHTLRIKETDRSAALQTELEKLGVDVKLIGDDAMEITPGKLVQQPASIATYEDHRMAMAFAVFALVCDYVDIEEPAVVKKSYPDFWKDLENMGFVIEEIA